MDTEKMSQTDIKKITDGLNFNKTYPNLSLKNAITKQINTSNNEEKINGIVNASIKKSSVHLVPATGEKTVTTKKHNLFYRIIEVFAENNVNVNSKTISPAINSMPNFRVLTAMQKAKQLKTKTLHGVNGGLNVKC